MLNDKIFFLLKVILRTLISSIIVISFFNWSYYLLYHLVFIRFQCFIPVYSHIYGKNMEITEYFYNLFNYWNLIGVISINRSFVFDWLKVEYN